MKILTTIYELKNIEKLSAVADGFLVSFDQFGTRLTKSFSLDDLKKIIEVSNKLKKEVFLNANQIFTDEKLDLFKKFLKKLPINELSGIIVADLGAYQVLADLDLNSKIVYNPETLLTNSYDFNFLAKNKIKGAYVAKELTIKNILDIGRNKQYEMFMLAHGHLSMFYSKRQLINNYTRFNEIDNNYHNKQDLKLVEKNRKDDPYPILEDNAGTHVFRSQVFNSFNYLRELRGVIDYFVVDSIFKDDNYALEVLSMYYCNKLDETVKENLQRNYNEIWDDGFFNTKTIYKQKGNEND